MFAAGAIFLCPDARDHRILDVQGKLLVEGMMGTAPLITGALFANRLIRRAVCWVTLAPLPADWTGRIKC